MGPVRPRQKSGTAVIHILTESQPEKEVSLRYLPDMVTHPPSIIEPSGTKTIRPPENITR